MKHLAYLLVLIFAVSAPLAEAQWSNNNGGQELSEREKRKQAKQEAKQARVAAAKHYKEYMVQKRKALIFVKKIDDERSRNGSIRSFNMLYGEVETEDEEEGNGMISRNPRSRFSGGYGGYGNSGPSEEATKKAMDAERKKYERQIKKIDDQLEAQKTRIVEADLMTDELDAFIKKALE